MLTDWLMVIITAIYVWATIRIYKSSKQSTSAIYDQTDVLKQQLSQQIKQVEATRKKDALDYLVFSAFASTKSINPRNGAGRLCIDEIYGFQPINDLGYTKPDIDESVKRLLFQQKLVVCFESEITTEQQYRITREVQ